MFEPRLPNVEDDYDGEAGLGNKEFSRFTALSLMRWLDELQLETTRLGLTLVEEVPEIKRQLAAFLLSMEMTEELMKKELE